MGFTERLKHVYAIVDPTGKPVAMRSPHAAPNLALRRGATSRAKRSKLGLISSGRIPGGTAQLTMSVNPYSSIKAASSATQ